MGSVSYFVCAIVLVSMLCVITAQNCPPRCVGTNPCLDPHRCDKQSRCTGDGRVFKPNAGFCGCCSHCIRPIRQGRPCTPRNPRRPSRRQCGLGLCCNQRTRRCTPAAIIEKK